MREVVLTVPRAAVEDVLDRLLPLVPGGVREVSRGARTELRMRGDQLPHATELERAAGRWKHELREREVPDDWRERRLIDYEPEVIAERLVVRPDWAPPATTGVIDIALAEGDAFGTGTHPTTRGCLELLLGLEPLGTFTDLGCGTGVLAILARRLGWRPVLALDAREEAVAATAANARRNGTEIECRVADLIGGPPPVAAGFAANVPPGVHAPIASSWRDEAVMVGIVSGFGPESADSVLIAYARAGLRERARLVRDGWVIAELDRA